LLRVKVKLLKASMLDTWSFKATIHIDGFLKNNCASNVNLQTFSEGLISAYETITLWWEVSCILKLEAQNCSQINCEASLVAFF
jgi:hypothetical protein